MGLYQPDEIRAYEKLILLEYFLTWRNNILFSRTHRRLTKTHAWVLRTSPTG